MDNGLEYAKMIEVPTSTCEYSFKRKRSFFKKKKVINAVNKAIKQSEDEDANIFCEEECNEKNNCKNKDKNLSSSEKANNKASAIAVYDKKIAKKEKIKSAVISAQVVAVFALISAIILTNVFWENSGMNTLFKSVFFNDQTLEDNRSYEDFTLTLPVGDQSGVTVCEGEIGITGEYSLYPVCEGEVVKVEKATDGTYTVTVKHSESFSSVTEGLDLVYFASGEQVTRNMPLGYVKNTAKVYVYNGESLITDYAAVENSIIFNK